MHGNRNKNLRYCSITEDQNIASSGFKVKIDRIRLSKTSVAGVRAIRSSADEHLCTRIRYCNFSFQSQLLINTNVQIKAGKRIQILRVFTSRFAMQKLVLLVLILTVLLQQNCKSNLLSITLKNK